MIRGLTWALAFTIVGTMSLGVALSAGADGDGTIDVAVQVSPSTIVLGTDKGASVTVHTDIPYGMVDGSSVALNGVPASGVGADNRGDLVAKFPQADIEALIAPPSATLTLTGQTKDGVPFAGSDTVRVIEDPSPH